MTVNPDDNINTKCDVINSNGECIHDCKADGNYSINCTNGCCDDDNNSNFFYIKSNDYMLIIMI